MTNISQQSFFSKTSHQPSLFLVFIFDSQISLFSLYQQASDQGPSGDKNQKSKRIEEDSGEPAAKKPNSKIQILPSRYHHPLHSANCHLYNAYALEELVRFSVEYRRIVLRGSYRGDLRHGSQTGKD